MPAPGGVGGASEPLEWSFLQCFGERSPGEDIQEGAAPRQTLQSCKWLVLVDESAAAPAKFRLPVHVQSTAWCSSASAAS